MQNDFVKIYTTILRSSIWGESDRTLRIWFGLLMLADSDGVVYGSTDSIAHIIRVSEDDFLDALEILMSPDKRSSDGGDGIRIVRRDLDDGGGYLVTSYTRYYSKRTKKQMQQAEWNRRHREKAAEAELDGGEWQDQ